MDFSLIKQVLGNYEKPEKVSIAVVGAEKDKIKIERIALNLKEIGFLCWSAPTDLLPGHDVDLQTWKALQDAQIILLCLSKQFIAEGKHQKLLLEVLDTRTLISGGLIKVIPAIVEEGTKTPALLARMSLFPVNLLTEDGWNRLKASILLSKTQRPNIEQNYDIYK